MARVRLYPDPRFLNRIGWALFIWGMLGLVLLFVLNWSFGWHTPWPYLMIVGWRVGHRVRPSYSSCRQEALLGLADFPLSMLSAFSDVISYVRLMAVGLASSVLAESFNNMAVEIVNGNGGILNGPVRPGFVFGHSLNLGLAMIAMFAHGVRLNMLEFCNNLGMQWTGYRYIPSHNEPLRSIRHDSVRGVLWTYSWPVCPSCSARRTSSGQMGSVLALGMAALGSAIGIGLAGQAAAGAWAKEARAGRNLSFTYIILVGMPISQTLYAMIVMNNMSGVWPVAVHVGTVRSAVRNRIGHRNGRNAVRLDARHGRRGRDPRPERRRRQRIRVRHHRDGDRRNRRNLRDGVHAGHGAQLAHDCQATATVRRKCPQPPTVRRGSLTPPEPLFGAGL
jgi:F0F1-type ATP synthase membrane subunit c/vacuolar-type H+-ATPase subunit K